jgi:hypothetical protein
MPRRSPPNIVTELALTAARSGDLRGARWGEIEGIDWTHQAYGPCLATGSCRLPA